MSVLVVSRKPLRLRQLLLRIWSAVQGVDHALRPSAHDDMLRAGQFPQPRPFSPWLKVLR